MEKDITQQGKPAKRPANGVGNHHGHTVVAIGASAGGLEAIHEFFDNVPENTNVSFVVVQHLSPDYKSLLVELVAKHTHMNVFEAEHDMPVHKNCVYIIPNNKLMTIGAGKLQLTEKVPDKSPNTAIDFFLYSLAQDKGPNAIAVILSGTGTDGTRGIEAIKNAGGMVLVQDPCTAKFDGMPNSAIASGNADMILAPELMAEEIYTHLQETPIHILNKGKIDENLLEEVFRQVYRHSGHDFHFYKTPTIIRRISRRMSHKGIKKLEDYVTYLQQNPEEAKALCKDFLIGVTKFFRDPAAFEILYNEVFPAILSNKNQEGDTFKVWIAACSTGEEAYSMAMLIDKYLLANRLSVEVKIFATDIDEAALEVASKGTYTDTIEKDIDPDTLERYFVKEGNLYHVGSHIRKQIVFAKHNIIKDPPFIKNDLVSNRNMLIYMSNVLQKKVIATLHFSLNHEGFLLLGPSETVSNMQDSLQEVNTKWKIYKKDGNSKMPHTDALYNKSPDYGRYARESRPERGKFSKPARDIAADFRDVLADELGFAAFYIDHNYEIKEATGNYTKYISLPEGKLHLNLLKLLPPELSVALNSALRRAQTENKKINVKSVRVKGKTRNRYISLIVKPGNKEVQDSFMLVVFGENKNERNGNKPAGDVPADTSPELNRYIIELEAELKETRTELQMAVQGLETANEELQSSNEELLSANEELQSSNEELQSLNEELHTLNTEHQLKIRELMELNDDLNNYFRSADVAQIFLDRKMIIRKFNPAAVKLVNLIETDIGRPISHISTNLRYHDLIDDIQQVMDSGRMFEKEMRLNNGKSSLMHILPYVRQDKQNDGVVITFVDISDLRERDNIIKGVFDSSPSAIMAFSAVRNERNQIVDFKWLATNYAADKLLGQSTGAYTGKFLKKEFPAVFENEFFEKYVNVVKNDTPLSFEYNYQANGFNLWFEIVAIKMMDGLVVTLTDVSEKKEAEEKLKRNYSELMNVKENLRKLNLELEDKVRERTQKLTESEERFRLVTKATNESIWDWDLGNNKMWWSEGFYSRFNYPKDNNQVYNSAFKLDKIHPDDRRRVTDSIHQHINNNSRTWSAEYRFAKADGTYARILDRGYILHDEFNTPYRMLGSMLDITELRNAEAEVLSNIEQRKFLAESMPLIVWTATPEGELNFLNKEFEKFSGISIKEGLQSGWEKIVHPEDQRELDREWHHALRQRKSFSIELRLRKHDGTFCWHIVKANPKKDEGGVLLWVGTFTDIHEQKMANEVLESRVKERTKELQQMNDELESSNMELQQFASVASHDLKEPLRKIHMFSNLIKEKYFEEAADAGAISYIDRIINSSARMTTLVNDLLSFSRLSVNHLFRPTSLNALMTDILADLELVIQEKQAVIEVGPLPEIDAVPGQMRQVFQNIMSNALKFSRKDEPPVIKVTAEIVAEKSIDSPPTPHGNYARISIIDNGIGFDEQYRDKIFTIFQRLHTKEKYEGTGIGLAITKKIIDKHSGTITANSTEGRGSNFIIVLPIKQTAE